MLLSFLSLNNIYKKSHIIKNYGTDSLKLDSDFSFFEVNSFLLFLYLIDLSWKKTYN